MKIQSATEAREVFPCGLFQPEGSFRFSVEALLLAYSPSLQKKARIADLGTGCGVAALAVLLRDQEVSAYGFEKQLDLCQTARQNAQLLGLEDRFSVENITLSSKRSAASLALMNNSFDAVMANPPFYLVGQGRLPKTNARQEALFGSEETLNDFCSTASRLLVQGGVFTVIFTPLRLPELFDTLKKNSFGIRSLRVVYGKANTPAQCVLVSARKKNADDLYIEPPLILHNTSGELTREALTYCPILASPSSLGSQKNKK